MTLSLGERLSRRLQITSSGCHVWTGPVDKKGYGRISRGPASEGIVTTHRAAWIVAHGPIPDGMWVLHHCDNPPCCNPAHLFLGTHEDNMRDMATKGRAASLRGVASPRCKMSDQQVDALRHLATSGMSFAELGRRFSISDTHARRVALGLRRSRP